MVDVTHDKFQQKVCNTTSPSSKKNRAIFALFFHLEITKLAFHSAPLVSMFTPGVPQVSVAVSETTGQHIEDLFAEGAPSVNKIKFSSNMFFTQLTQIKFNF